MKKSIRVSSMSILAAVTMVAFQNCGPAFEVSASPSLGGDSGPVILSGTQGQENVVAVQPAIVSLPAGTATSASNVSPAPQAPAPVAPVAAPPAPAAPVFIPQQTAYLGPVITRFPSDQVVPVGSLADLRVEVSGQNLKTQWYILLEGESAFIPIIGATYPDLSFKMHIGNSIGVFRLDVSNEYGTASHTFTVLRP